MNKNAQSLNFLNNRHSENKMVRNTLNNFKVRQFDRTFS